jgi:hypothetical protein
VVPQLRLAFNRTWTEERYGAMLEELGRRVAAPIEFPIAETPCFFPRSLLDRLSTTGTELIRQSLDASALGATSALTPARYRGPNEGDHPLFIQVDFGLERGADGSIEPRLVELQAFPSLYGFQPILADSYLKSFEYAAPVGVFLDGLDAHAYRTELGAAIVGTHQPENVVLMEIEPARQKTRPDFLATESLWGVRTVDTREVARDGRRLWYRRDGKRTPIHRIYNRVIPDELDRSGAPMSFDYRDDMDVEWAGHPAWYFRLSKASIPWLRHASVPRTWQLEAVEGLPLPSDRLLLKPLFSFAGGGIVFAPSADDLDRIPGDRRREFILQERVSFTPLIDTPQGATQAEVRMMYVWRDRLRPVLALVRMGRGRMMGVDHNKGLRWVGASAALVVD